MKKSRENGVISYDRNARIGKDLKMKQVKMQNITHCEIS